MKVIQAADIVIDAFGSAKTANNNTSSRFGKFVELFYEKEIQGAQIKTYLLEKGRVVSSPSSESNFSIFYMMTSCD